MARAAQGRSEAGLCLRAVSDVQGKEPYRPSMRALPGPGGGQAFLPQAPHTGRRGTRPGCGRDEDLDPLPVGRVQPGPQSRCRGALIEEVPDEDTRDTRGAGRMEQRGALLLLLDRISLRMLRGDGERHRVDVVGGDAGYPAPTAEVQHCLPADPGRLGLHDAGQHRCHRIAWYNSNLLILFRFCLH
jgi:hypothetical protein